MSLDTFGSLILLGLALLCYIGMKVSEKYVSVKYYDQKIGEPKKKRGAKK